MDGRAEQSDDLGGQPGVIGLWPRTVQAIAAM
jgi:hypothetical protein